jgi:flagellin-specific chaperone FliS
MKVKFNRKRLIAALKDSRAKALDQHRNNVRQYHIEFDLAKAQHVQNVQKYLAEITKSRNGKAIASSSNRLYERFFEDADLPSEPKPPRLDHVDALIAQLSLSDDEVITCDTKEEYVQLTRACAVLGTCRA